MQIVTRGFDTGSSGGTVALVVTRGYAIGTPAPPTPHGNTVVPNTVAHLGQLFKKTVLNDPFATRQSVAGTAPRGPSLRDQERERIFTEQRDYQTLMTIFGIVADLEDE